MGQGIEIELLAIDSVSSTSKFYCIQLARGSGASIKGNERKFKNIVPSARLRLCRRASFMLSTSHVKKRRGRGAPTRAIHGLCRLSDRRRRFIDTDALRAALEGVVVAAAYRAFLRGACDSAFSRNRVSNPSADRLEAPKRPPPAGVQTKARWRRASVPIRP